MASSGACVGDYPAVTNLAAIGRHLYEVVSVVGSVQKWALGVSYPWSNRAVVPSTAILPGSGPKKSDLI